MIPHLQETVALVAKVLPRQSPGPWPLRGLGLLAILCVGALPTVPTASLAQPVECRPWPTLSDSERDAVHERMRTERGFTILFRHADKLSGDSDRKTPTTTIEKTECKKFEQRLNDHGVEQAESVRAAFDFLDSSRDVRIDQVTASNSCRALETARIAFGAPMVRIARDKDLNTGNENMSLRERVRKDIGAINRVLVSHSGDINNALNVTDVPRGRLGCGEAAILKIEAGDRNLICLARILPEEWTDPNFELVTGYYENSACRAGALSARSAS